MNNRDIMILGAIILVGAIAVELYSNFANPLIDYLPASFNSLLIDTPQRFDYYKDGTLIGNYSYILTSQTSNSQKQYLLITAVEATYKEAKINVTTNYRFLGETTLIGYNVEANLAGVESQLECIFSDAKVNVIVSSQGKNQTTTITMPSNTVLIDNNNPAQWELIMKSFTAEVGKKYRINTLVPQGAVVQTIEFGVDTAHQYITIGSKSYECVVARAFNYDITLYFYQGNLIQYKNDADGILIVKKNVLD